MWTTSQGESPDIARGGTGIAASISASHLMTRVTRQSASTTMAHTEPPGQYPSMSGAARTASAGVCTNTDESGMAGEGAWNVEWKWHVK